MVCQDEETRDWLVSLAPTLRAWENSRLKLVDLDALPTYKRVAAWLPGSVVDTLHYPATPQIELGLGHRKMEGLQV